MFKQDGNKYKAKASKASIGRSRYLGIFSTPEEAALCYARHLGPQRVPEEVGHGDSTRPPPSVVVRASVERPVAPLSVAPLAVADPIISCQAASQAYGDGHGDSTRPPPAVRENPSGMGRYASVPGVIHADAYRSFPPPSVVATASVVSVAPFSVADALQALGTTSTLAI